MIRIWGRGPYIIRFILLSCQIQYVTELGAQSTEAMKQFLDINLKNKIFFTTVLVILAISAIIALLSRWILVSSLTSELELRGTAIAHSIAERGTGYLLDKNNAKLLSLIFDEARLRERHHLIEYIFITDENGDVLSHTFTRPFPEGLKHTNEVTAEISKSVRILLADGLSAYDIAVPIKEGLYMIGAVHVGLSKDHIDSLVSKLRITFLGFISLVIIIIFFISHWLARYITKPIERLTQMSDELSRGNFEISLDLGAPENPKSRASECPAYITPDLPCWQANESFDPPETGWEIRTCGTCRFYSGRKGDEVVQLADSFKNMVRNIKFYRRRLRESEEKYRSLFDSGPDPIFVVSFDSFKILDANPRAREVYGYTHEELIGKSFFELSGENETESFADFQNFGNKTSSVSYPKVVHYKKGKTPFFVNLHACPISYQTRPAIIVATADITEMVEKDAQIIQASKLKTLGEMSAGIAHEINQPLNAIKMGSDFLAMVSEEGGELPKDQFHGVLKEISAQVDRASEIINTLRSFGRKADLVKEKIDINKSIRGVLSIVGRQFELQQIRFEMDLADELPKVLAHDNRIQQVLFNLITNARDAINEKSQAAEGKIDRMIAIHTRAESGNVIVEVADTGAGIPDSVRDKIFEPFFTTKTSSNDMGLGLAITIGIVKDYGGKIEIESAEGEGTTFVVSFPMTWPDLKSETSSSGNRP